MFEKNINIGSKNIIFYLKDSPINENLNNFIFGFPYNENLEELNNSNIKEKIEKLKGYFLYIGFEQDKIIIANDIAGGYRLYYYEYDNNIYFSDSYKYLKNILKSKGDIEKINAFEYKFWKKHRYTTGDSTFTEQIKKVKPAAIFEITDTACNETIYFKDLSNTPNYKKHIDGCFQDLDNTFRNLKNRKEKKVLFFSGGADSTLLAHFLQRHNVDFIPVFMKLNPLFELNYNDFLRSKAVAKKLGMEIFEINIEIKNALKDIEHITEHMIMDRHFSLFHFEGVKAIKEKFGTDLIFLNGQSSDSINSLGPSGENFGGFISRNAIHKYKSAFTKFLLQFVRLKFGKNFYSPANDKEFYRVFLDETLYRPMLDKNEDIQYYNYIDEIVLNLKSNFKNRYAFLMYLKIFGFLQGPDNQVVLKSAKSCEINKVVMPYTSPDYIYNTIKYIDINREIWNPKYVIRDLLKEKFHYQMPEYQDVRENIECTNLDDIEAISYKYFYDYVQKELNLI